MSTIGTSGTLRALGEIYESRYRRFVRLAEAILGDSESARDAVQDAFARLIRSRGDFRGEGSLEGWVWRTVVNTARNARRDRPPAHRPLDATPELCTNSHAHDGRLRALLTSLPERQRLVLFLRYYADLDYQAIANVLDIQPGTVGSTLNHAHAAIRRLLEEVPQ